MGKLARFIHFYTDEDDGGGGGSDPLITLTGDIIRFLAKAVKPFTLSAELEPVQDLHGQDNPYPPGGGKNILDPSLLEDQASWNVITLNVEPNTQYTCSTNKGDGTSTGLLMYFNNDGSAGGSATSAVSSSHPVTVTSTVDGHVYISQRRSSGEDSYANYKTQVEKGSSATAFAPYSNLCPISGWTGVSGQHTGKNLLKVKDATDVAVANGKFNSSNGVLTRTGTGAVSALNYITHAALVTLGMDVEVPPGTYYFSGTYISGDYPNLKYIAQFQYDDGTFVTQVYGSPITLTKKAKLYAVQLSPQSPMDANTTNVTVFQLEVGSTASPYETAKVTEIEVDWEDEAGTVYGAKVDVTAGTLTVDRLIKNITANDVISYDSAIASPRFHITGFDAFDRSEYFGFTDLSNVYLNGSSPLATASTAQNVFCIYGSRCYFRDSRFSNTTDMKSWLVSNNVCFVGHLKEPLVYQLDPVTLQSLVGENTVWLNESDSLTVQCYGKAIDDGNESPQNALGILLGGAYYNNGEPGEPKDRDALSIILGN